MLPEARGESLAYVSDSGTTGLVYVFSYPTGKRVGTLTGFYFPTGECVDKHGDVWVLNMSPEVIVEYAHGGTSPIATLDDPVGGFSCSTRRPAISQLPPSIRPKSPCMQMPQARRRSTHTRVPPA